ncbi:MAG: hypothetical protein FWG58_04615 [Methanomassiliicoccaceae archaeon]|nr:hypothetical protein [Methanomassiliicoccaceae archaeon]
MTIPFSTEWGKQIYDRFFSDMKYIGMSDREASMIVVSSLNPRNSICKDRNITPHDLFDLRHRAYELIKILRDYAGKPRKAGEPMLSPPIKELLPVRGPSEFEHIRKKMLDRGMTEQEAELLAMRIVRPDSPKSQIKVLKLSERDYYEILDSAMKKYLGDDRQ